jgi:hypothetical protein
LDDRIWEVDLLGCEEVGRRDRRRSVLLAAFGLQEKEVAPPEEARMAEVVSRAF